MQYRNNHNISQVFFLHTNSKTNHLLTSATLIAKKAGFTSSPLHFMQQQYRKYFKIETKVYFQRVWWENQHQDLRSEMSKRNIVKQEIFLSDLLCSLPQWYKASSVYCPLKGGICEWKTCVRRKPTQKLLMKRYLRTIAQNSTESWLCKFEINQYHLSSVIWNL